MGAGWSAGLRAQDELPQDLTLPVTGGTSQGTWGQVLRHGPETLSSAHTLILSFPLTEGKSQNEPVFTSVYSDMSPASNHPLQLLPNGIGGAGESLQGISLTKPCASQASLMLYGTTSSD